MKMKIAPLALIAIGFVSVLMISPSHATLTNLVSAHTDKASYLPGDTGTLYVTVLNTGTQAFTVKNVSVTYPWKAYITNHWDGNFTDLGTNNAGINDALAQGQAFNKQYSFTVPTDGRAYSFSFLTPGIQVSVGTDIQSGPYAIPSTTATFSIATATYQPFGLTTSILPIVSIVLLAVAVIMLFMVYMGVGKLSKKQ
jgi:hypothetical protein